MGILTELLPGLTKTALQTAIDLRFDLGEVDAGITFTRASAKTRVNPMGLIESLANDVPAIDYDPATLATSTTSLSVGLGVKALTLASGVQFLGGTPIRISRTSDPTNTWMAGIAMPLADGSLRVIVLRVVGTGTFTDWTIIACLGLSREEARTNILTYSNQFDLGWSIAGAEVTADAITAPDGTLTADLLLDNTGTSRHTRYQTISVPDMTATYAFSVYAKAGSGVRYLTVYMASGGFQGANRCGRSFDLTNGTMGTGTNDIGSGVLSDSDCIYVGGGWYRCVIVGTMGIAGAGSISFSLAVNSVFGGGNVGTSYTGDGTSGFYVWEAQAELGAFATSPIHTTTEAVARQADVAVMTGTNFTDWYRQDEGTFVVTARTNDIASIDATVFSITDDGTTQADQIDSRFSSGNSAIRIRVRSGGANQLGELIMTGSGGSAFTTLAAGFAANSGAASANGGALSTDASGVMPAVNMTRLILGDRGSSGGSDDLSGHIMRFRYFDRRLPDTMLDLLSRAP